MKKTAILLIALMVISVGFVDICAAELEKCSPCGGTGKCNRCDGTGLGLEWNLQCDTCKGTGNCQTCGGSGYIEQKTPGFELIFVVFAIALILLWKRKKLK